MARWINEPIGPGHLEVIIRDCEARLGEGPRIVRGMDETGKSVESDRAYHIRLAKWGVDLARFIELCKYAQAEMLKDVEGLI